MFSFLNGLFGAAAPAGPPAGPPAPGGVPPPPPPAPGGGPPPVVGAPARYPPQDFSMLHHFAGVAASRAASNVAVPVGEVLREPPRNRMVQLQALPAPLHIHWEDPIAVVEGRAQALDYFNRQLPLPPPPGRSISQDIWWQICGTHYIGDRANPGTITMTRGTSPAQFQLPSVHQILANPARYGATEYREGGNNNVYECVYRFQHELHSNIVNDSGNSALYYESLNLTVEYLRPILNLSFQQDLIPTKKLLRTAEAQLNFFKIGMAAYCIHAFVFGFDCTFNRDAPFSALSRYARDQRNLYYCYILPLAQLITLHMDNKRGAPNFSVVAIVGQSLDSFTRNVLRNRIKLGVWSVEFLEEKSRQTISKSSIKLMTQGVEWTTARIFMMLAPGVEMPQVENRYLTIQQHAIFESRQPISATVKSRVHVGV
jgi:hypothetical protein